MNSEFIAAVNKARLVYDNIELSTFCNLALLWDDKYTEEKPAEVVFMGKDGKVHVEKCKYDICRSEDTYIEVVIGNDKDRYTDKVEYYLREDKEAVLGGAVIPTRFEDEFYIGTDINFGKKAVALQMAETGEWYNDFTIGILYESRKEVMRHIGKWQGWRIKNKCEIVIWTDDGYDIDEDCRTIKPREDGMASTKIYMEKHNGVYVYEINHENDRAPWVVYGVPALVNKSDIHYISRGAYVDANVTPLKRWNIEEIIDGAVRISGD